MKKTVLLLLLALTILLGGCSQDAPSSPTSPTTLSGDSTACTAHIDDDNNGVCDSCYNTVYVYFDFYVINDLHGKLADGTNHPGVDELTTYLKNARKKDDCAIFLSAGDMWQGSSESNMTNGHIITEWMNELGFAGMALGNHEFDWGTDAIKSNHAIAEFPFLAINVYDRETNALASYCTPSTMVEANGMQIGIIGAIGDCYSSIAVDKCRDVYFKTGKDLTALVKAESQRLRNEGADFIVYTIHDGYDKSGNQDSISSSKISSYYDTSLSDGYVDLVFEGHTHQGYRITDEYGVYHLQNRGDNKGGISHVEIAINSVNNTSSVRLAELVSTDKYKLLDDDPIVSDLMDKYDPQISEAFKVVGYNSYYRSGDYMRQLVADQYYMAGVEKWGDEYDIVLGGGYISVRSPYNLSAGDVTYGDLYSLFPFDNELTLCSIKGKDLQNKFFNTSNEDYFIDYGDYGAEVRSNIDQNATYYIIVDTYSAYYAPNKLTVVESYGSPIYARDLLADYLSDGGLE